MGFMNPYPYSIFAYDSNGFSLDTLHNCKVVLTENIFKGHFCFDYVILFKLVFFVKMLNIYRNADP